MSSSRNAVPGPRRAPQQLRSRERVEAILEATRDLVGAHGNDAVSMRDIAGQAGVPIGSLYQYFPDKTALLRQVMEGFLLVVRERLVAAFSDVQAPADVGPAAERAIDAMRTLFQEDPRLPRIWAAVQANEVLSDVDAEDSKQNASFLAAQICNLVPTADPKQVFAACLFAAHVAGPVVRLADTLDEDTGNRLVDELKQLVNLRLSSLLAVG